MKKKESKPIKSDNSIKDIQDYLKEKSERDYLLFVIGITTGYRGGDLVDLKVRDIKKFLDDGYFSILEKKKINRVMQERNLDKRARMLKEIKPREVIVVPLLRRILRDYIVNMRDYEYIFPSRKGSNKHILVSRASSILKEAGEYFGLKDISCHSMRKTYGYKIYEETQDIFVVKEMLGHSSIEVTKRYIGLDKETYAEYSQSLNNMLI